MEIDRLKKNLAEMLANRGEDVTAFSKDLAETPTERFYTDVLTFKTRTTTVWTTLSKDIFKELWKTLRDASAGDLIDEHETQRFILVVNEKPSSQTLPQLIAKDDELLPRGGMFQLFMLKDLFINPTAHTLVPKHERMDETEIKELMEQLKIKSKIQLPSIQRSDAIAIWLGLRPGDVVRITRVSPTSGESLYYRCCVADRAAKAKS